MKNTSKRSDTDQKALDLHDKVTTIGDDDEKYLYSVPSSNNKDSYTVTHLRAPERGENEWLCACKAFQFRAHTSLEYACSHIKAVHLALENGIITHTHSAKDVPMANNATIAEARLTGSIERDAIDSLLRMDESTANTTDIVITMRVRATDFRLNETTFSCLNGLTGTIVVNPNETDIDVQLQAEQTHEATLPVDQMNPPPPDRELVPSADNSLPF